MQVASFLALHGQKIVLQPRLQPHVALAQLPLSCNASRQRHGAIALGQRRAHHGLQRASGGGMAQRLNGGSLRFAAPLCPCIGGQSVAAIIICSRCIIIVSLRSIISPVGRMLVAIVTLGNRDGHPYRHRLVIAVGQAGRHSLMRSSRRGLLARRLCLGYGRKSLLHTVLHQIALRHHHGHFVESVPDFLFRREMPEGSRRRTQYQHHGSRGSHPVVAWRQEPAFTCHEEALRLVGLSVRLGCGLQQVVLQVFPKTIPELHAGIAQAVA